MFTDHGAKNLPLCRSHSLCVLNRTIGRNGDLISKSLTEIQISVVIYAECQKAGDGELVI